MQGKTLSFTIPTELYEAFASYAASKRVAVTALFRHALTEFAAYALPDPVADAEFEASRAEVEARQEVSELPLTEKKWDVN